MRLLPLCTSSAVSSTSAGIVAVTHAPSQCPSQEESSGLIVYQVVVALKILVRYVNCGESLLRSTYATLLTLLGSQFTPIEFQLEPISSKFHTDTEAGDFFS